MSLCRRRLDASDELRYRPLAQVSARRIVAPVPPCRDAIGVETQHAPTTDVDFVLEVRMCDGAVAGSAGASTAFPDPLTPGGGQRKKPRRNLGPDPDRDVAHGGAPVAKGVPVLVQGDATICSRNQRRDRPITDEPFG